MDLEFVYGSSKCLLNFDLVVVHDFHVSSSTDRIVSSFKEYNILNELPKTQGIVKILSDYNLLSENEYKTDDVIRELESQPGIGGLYHTIKNLLRNARKNSCKLFPIGPDPDIDDVNKQNEIMLENICMFLENDKKRPALLIIGSAHTKLTEMLSNKGYTAGVLNNPAEEEAGLLNQLKMITY